MIWQKLTNKNVEKKPGRASKQTPGSWELTDHKVNYKQKLSNLWN